MYAGALQLLLVVASLHLAHTVQLHQQLVTPHRAPRNHSEDAALQHGAHHHGRNGTSSSRHGGSLHRLHSQQKGAVTSHSRHVTSGGDIIHYLHRGDQEKPQKKGSFTERPSANPSLIPSQGAAHRQVAAPTSVVIMHSGSIDYALDNLDPVPELVEQPAGAAVATTPAAAAVVSLTTAPVPLGGAVATAAPVAGVAGSTAAAAATAAPLVATVAPPGAATVAPPGAAGAAPGVPAAAAPGAATPPAKADSEGGGIGIGMLFLILLIIVVLAASAALLVKGRAKMARDGERVVLERSRSTRLTLAGSQGTENEEPGGSAANSENKFWSTAKTQQSYRKSAMLAAGLSSGGSEGDAFQSVVQEPKSSSGASRSAASYTKSRGAARMTATLSDRPAPASASASAADGGRSGARSRGTKSQPLSQLSGDDLDVAKTDEGGDSAKRGTAGASYRGRRQLQKGSVFKADKVKHVDGDSFGDVAKGTNPDEVDV